MTFVKKYCILVVLAFGMLLISVVIFAHDNAANNMVFDILSFRDSDYPFEITPYYDKVTGKYYLFLPSYTNKDKISLQCKKGALFDFQTNEVHYKRFDELPLSEDIIVTVKSATGNDRVTMQVLQCENVPTVYIATESGSLDFVNTSKNNTEKTAVYIINPDGTVEHCGVAEISGAGNSTVRQAKRPYNLTFERPVDLFGIANVSKWRLMANYADDSMLRNYICYNVANDIGIAYTSAMEYVSVFLNGQYNGVYTLCTKNKYENDIGTILAIFEKSNSDREYDYVSAQNTENTYITFCYGNNDLVKATVDTFNEALYNTLSYEQIAECIDVNSFAKKYFIEEILANCDNALSQYFAIDKAGKIIAVNAWDYDLSLGISWKAYVDMPYNNPAISKSWYKALWTFPEFQQLVLSVAEEYATTFSSEISLYIAQATNILHNDWTMNNLRWNSEVSFFDGRTKLKCVPGLHTLSDHAEYIEDFLTKRFGFLIDYWTDSTAFRSVIFHCNGEEMRAFYPYNQLFTDDTFPDGVSNLYDDKESFIGWYTEDGVELRDISAVSEDMTFYATWEKDENVEIAQADVSNELLPEDSIIKLVKWPIRNLGFQETAIILSFAMTFLIVIIINIRNTIWRKGRKNE